MTRERWRDLVDLFERRGARGGMRNTPAYGCWCMYWRDRSIPHGTPKVLLPLIFLIELLSFMVRPFSLALRLFVAMIAGHILVEVFGSFVVSGINAGGIGPVVSILSFVFIVGVMALELLVCAIQAYVFALLTSLYINDAVNLH